MRGEKTMFDFNAINQAVIDQNIERTYDLTRQAIKADVSPNDILSKGLVPGLARVGDLFEKGEYFLPELIVSGDAVMRSMELLAPILDKQEMKLGGKFLIGTVKDDLHEIGKNIVIMMLKGNGWEVNDLGMNVSSEAFCSELRENNYDLIGISALLTMTMPNVADTIKAIRTAGLRDNIKILVGGAPTSQKWANEIGADGWAADASQAVKVAASLLKSLNRSETNE
jgi:5-methyltetrahydrofolate--homocysteine methyltransferase